MHGPKKTEAQIQRQRDQLNRAVIAAVSSTRKDVDVTQAGLAEQMAWSREIVSSGRCGRRRGCIATAPTGSAWYARTRLGEIDRPLTPDTDPTENRRGCD